MLFPLLLLFPQVLAGIIEGEAKIHLWKVVFQFSSEQKESKKGKLYIWVNASPRELEKCFQDCALLSKFLGHSLISHHQRGTPAILDKEQSFLLRLNLHRRILAMQVQWWWQYKHFPWVLL